MAYTYYVKTIVRDALETVGAIPTGGDISPDLLGSMSAKLNMIVQGLQAHGIRLWTVEETIKTFSAPSEYIGTDGLNYTCIYPVTTAAANQPITGAQWAAYFAQHGTAGIAWSNSLTATTPGVFDLPADTIGIEQAFLRDGDNEYPIEIISKAEYSDLPDKKHFARPTRLWPEVVTETTMRGRFDYQPDKTSYVLHYWRVRRQDDLMYGTSGLDFPQKLVNCLSKIMSAEIAPRYLRTNDNAATLNAIRADAREALALIKKEDIEQTGNDFIRSAF